MGNQNCKKCGAALAKKDEHRTMCNGCRGLVDRERARRTIEAKARHLAAGASYRANKKNIPCDIDALDIVELWYKQGGRCYYSGRPMTLQPSPRGVSVDRLDSKRGYTRKNTVLAARQVNSMKSDLPIKDFLSWCHDISQHQTPQEA